MNLLTVAGIRDHSSRELFPSLKRGQIRRYTFLYPRVRASSNYDSGLFDESLNSQEYFKSRRKSAMRALEKRVPSSSALSKSRRSPSCVFATGGYAKASFSTLPYHRSQNYHADLNGNGNAEPPEASQLDFTRISSLIESDSGIVDSSSIWYVVTTAALLGLNRQSMIEQLWKYISDQCGHDESRMLVIARRIREACLKSSVLVGFPHVSSLHITMGFPNPQAYLCINEICAVQNPFLTRYPGNKRPTITPILNRETLAFNCPYSRLRQISSFPPLPG